jgi:hypothetical protein
MDRRKLRKTILINAKYNIGVNPFSFDNPHIPSDRDERRISPYVTLYLEDKNGKCGLTWFRNGRITHIGAIDKEHAFNQAHNFVAYLNKTYHLNAKVTDLTIREIIGSDRGNSVALHRPMQSSNSES